MPVVDPRKAVAGSKFGWASSDHPVTNSTGEIQLTFGDLRGVHVETVIVQLKSSTAGNYEFTVEGLSSTYPNVVNVLVSQPSTVPVANSTVDGTVVAFARGY